jgi:hypothetical protein
MPLSATGEAPHVIETSMSYTGLFKIAMAPKELPPYSNNFLL